MSVQDIVNSQGLSLDNTDPLSVMSNGQATPSQIKELYESAQQEQDWKGATDLSVVNPDTLNTGVDIGKARAEFQRNGLPAGIEKPSKWGKLEDMLGSLLVGVALSALLGMDGKGAIGVGLMAAGSALDLDNAKAQRYDSIMSMDRTGINPAALVDYYNTGNLKGLQHYEDERNKREDALTSENWKREDAATEEGWKQQDAQTAFGNQLALAEYNQSQQNARAAMQENRADARAALKAGNNANGTYPTQYGHVGTDGNGNTVWIPTSKYGTANKDKNGNVEQYALVDGKWQYKGYAPDVGAGGNTRSDTAAQTSLDALQQASNLAKLNYNLNSSGPVHALQNAGGWLYGSKRDFDTAANSLNGYMNALKADRAVNSTAGKAILKGDMEQQLKSGGEISSDNSSSQNQQILDNNINFIAGATYMEEYQNTHNGNFPDVATFEKGRAATKAEIYKKHPELLNAFGEDNDLPGQSGNINSYPSADNTDYSKLWK
ncbi:TPA: hypothetical protein NQG77_000246 [Salmonella enterica subsp. enterica serovar Infantis]|nr:hypothetical protein [Salmonella enterica subsp. enterica serovar Infantis]